MSDTRAEFTATYDAHADALFRFALYGVGDRELAKDLVADTFTKVWEYIAKGNVAENVRALCYRTLRNLMIDHWRKKKSVSLDELADQGFEPVGEDGHENAEARSDAEMLRRAISLLPSAFREVILLRYVEGYSPKEIAEMLGISQTLVSVRLYRGTALLKKHLCI